MSVLSNRPRRQASLKDIALHMRVRQVKLAAKFVRALEPIPLGKAALVNIRRTRIGKSAMDVLLGYHRVFSTLAEAEHAVKPFANRGHQNVENADFHLQASTTPRPSDYAALYHLMSKIADARLIFDLGGNIGNLFYCYKKYLRFRDDLTWKVYDLPDHLKWGAALAEERKMDGICFTDRWLDADGADVLIASGSLHYFPPLAKLVKQLHHKPRSILINRTPLIELSSVAVVQDAGTFRVACMLYNRHELISDLERIGYRLADAWQAAELSMSVPGSPDHRVQAYSGLWFEWR